ncbi:unnamed protein product [Agarophyton chilense]
MLRNFPWVQLTEIHSAKHDIEASFALPPINAIVAPPQPSSSSAPHYSNEELEDELEHRFWEEEEKQYNRLMRSSKVVSNRRFGPQGYISGGRMSATPRPAPRPKKLLAGSSIDVDSQPSSSKPPKSGSSSGRKKKVKKKSRAGIAAAKAAEEAAKRETGSIATANEEQVVHNSNDAKTENEITSEAGSPSSI